MALRSRSPKSSDKTNKADKGPSSRSGRATPSPRASGRYTQPIPTAVRRSPRWYPYLLLGLLLAGVLTIILNYIDALPNSPSNWYTLGALLAIVVGALLATNYR